MSNDGDEIRHKILKNKVFVSFSTTGVLQTQLRKGHLAGGSNSQPCLREVTVLTKAPQCRPAKKHEITTRATRAEENNAQLLWHQVINTSN